MKTRIIILVSIALTSLSVCGQEWIGDQFTLDTIVAFQGIHTPGNQNLILCRMIDGTFYFVEQQGFQNMGNSYQAVVHTLSTDHYEQSEIVLPMPDGVRNKERYARSLWIYDFCLDGDYILLTTQEELILYKQIQNRTYRVEATYRHPNLFMGYLHENRIHFFEEDHDKGFKWFQQDLEGDSATLVRKLPYEAPHIVQIQPNRYISHNKQSVFFLSTRYPRVEVYDLDGTFRDTLRFDLPLWKAFEDEYIRKTLSVPYGIERIYAVKDDLNDYSYPKVIIPLRGDLLLFYMQFDTATGKSALQYAIRKENGLTTQYLRTNHEESTYHAARFPFTLFQGAFDKGNAADDGKIVQLTYKTDVPWQGKTPSEYISDVNKYFSEHNPVLAYKVMRYTPPDPPFDEGQLHTTSGDLIRMDALPSDKCVLVLHSGLECSGCVKAVYKLLAESTTEDIHIGHVYPTPINGMAAYELAARIRQNLNKPFALYYDTSDHYMQLSPTPPLQESDFPCVILYEKGKTPRIFRNGNLFTPNFSITEFRESFLDAWYTFLKH